MILYNAADGYECDECYVEGVLLVEMRSEQDDNGPWLCGGCLREALALMEDNPCVGMHLTKESNR